MGSFAGHAIPGTFFIGLAIWWTVAQFLRYFMCLERKTRFKSTPTYPLSCGKHSFSLFEPILKICVVSIGLFGEIYTGYDSTKGKFTFPGNAQHATMFTFYGIGGVIDILVHYGAPLPKDIEYAVALLALGVECLLFHFHLHDRSPLDVRLHTLLIYAIVFNIVGVILEMKYRHNLLAGLSRSYFFFVQGTWFWQIGFILYNPSPNAQPWKADDQEEMMYVTMYLSWHYLIVLLTILILGSSVACFHRHCNHSNQATYLPMKRFTAHRNENFISIEDSGDSEL